MVGAVGSNVRCLAVYLVCALLHQVYLNHKLMINGSIVITNFKIKSSSRAFVVLFDGFSLGWLLFVGVLLFRIREKE
mgnify:CR=1 FL=1